MKKGIIILGIGILLQSCLAVGVKGTSNSETTYIYNTTINGNGDVHLSDRTVGEYQGVMVNGPFQVIFKDGLPNGTIEVEADENLLPYIETSVSENMLNINAKAELKGFTKLKVYVTK